MQALDPVFSPRTVAVVGASRSRDSIGWSIVHNMIEAQFTGAIYPVNPKAQAIHSLKCYASLAAIPDAIDLAVVTVPRALVQGVVEEAIALGVRAFVVITAGYGETGEEGRALEAKLRATIRAAGARMVGPNCMGVINTDAAVSLNATFSPTPAVAGSVGFVSQSGALGVAILNVAAQLGIGLTQFVSMGNKADVSGNDLVEYWENDPATKVMCMYLESFGNPRRFTEIAKRVTRKKPILIVKSGRTAEGARAARPVSSSDLARDLVQVATFGMLLAQAGEGRGGVFRTSEIEVGAAEVEERFVLAGVVGVVLEQPLDAGRRRPRHAVALVEAPDNELVLGQPVDDGHELLPCLLGVLAGRVEANEVFECFPRLHRRGLVAVGPFDALGERGGDLILHVGRAIAGRKAILEVAVFGLRLDQVGIAPGEGVAVGDRQQRLAAGARIRLDLEGVREVGASAFVFLEREQAFAFGQGLGGRKPEDRIVLDVRLATDRQARNCRDHDHRCEPPDL